MNTNRQVFFFLPRASFVIAIRNLKENKEKKKKRKTRGLFEVNNRFLIVCVCFSFRVLPTDPNYKFILVLPCPLSPKRYATPGVAHKSNIAML